MATFYNQPVSPLQQRGSYGSNVGSASASSSLNSNAPHFSAPQHSNYTQQQQQQSNNPPQQQQQQQPWNPTSMAAAAMMQGGLQNQNAMLDLGLSAASSMASQSMGKFVPGASSFYDSLKYYFAVSNTYVVIKLKMLLIPYTNKAWRRQTNQDGTFLKPSQDLNAPDLYIPTMSLLTYVLLSGLCYGASGQFTPAVLQDVTGYCLMTQGLEVAAIRAGHYALQAPCGWTDVAAYTGYKYFGLCINMLVGLTLGYWPYNLSLLFTAGGIFYFTLKTFANNVKKETARDGPKREFVVLGFAAAQVVTMWFLGNTKHLS
mmetsp:Transcript_1723/g.3790  ORF Transcript_1723/g.3790 Transcript_1723/m.3790 type:complete len:316 (+) Transcript_1723:73-1020(+)